jgi:hypothetical protein
LLKVTKFRWRVSLEHDHLTAAAPLRSQRRTRHYGADALHASMIAVGGF